MEASMEDIAPTLLHLMGEAVLSYMDGCVRAGSMKSCFAQKNMHMVRRWVKLTKAQSQAIETRLQTGVPISMHILHVACMPYPSMQGSQVYLRGLIQAQAQRNQVFFCVMDTDQKLDDQGYRIIRAPNIGSYRNMRAGPIGISPYWT